MPNRTFILLVMIVSILISTTALSQDKPPGKVHGYFFGDYYYMVGADTAKTRGVGQHSSTPKAFQAFQFRRLYLYYDHTFDENFTAQFLLEGNDKTFESGGKHTVFVKTAYLEWKGVVPMGSLAFGLVPTPTWTWAGSEKTWNYRSIEKTIVDFRGLGSASDMGVALRGKFDSEGIVSYVAMIGNGNGQKPENNKYKKYYGSLIVKPLKELLIDAYLDYEPGALDKNKTTLRGFAAYQAKSFTVGAELVQQTQSKAGALNTDIIPFGFSLFAWVPIPGVEGLNAFARFDSFDPDTKVTNQGFKESFYALGFDYMPISNVHIMPNVWVNSFSAKGTGSKDADVVARISFFIVYK